LLLEVIIKILIVYRISVEHARTPKEFGPRGSRGGGGRYGGGGGSRRDKYNTMHMYVQIDKSYGSDFINEFKFCG